ncbi:hypothetical protein AAVH_23367 [Aphelenchoides avenae]|nr:hypothetical protein AAVH_23367 [Aphelenchus avenae]
MDNSDAQSQHSSETAADEEYTVEQMKADAEAETTAFKTSMDMKLGDLAELMSREFTVNIQDGIPAKDELTRLTETCEEIRHNRNSTMRLREILQKQHADFDAYRLSLPASKPAVRGKISMRYNQYMAAFNLEDRRAEALTHADRMATLLTDCRISIDNLRAEIRLDEVAAADPLDGEAAPAADVADVADAVDDADAADAADAAAAADAVDGVNGAIAASIPDMAAAIEDLRKKTDELIRAATGTSSAKETKTSGPPTHDAAKEFGDTTPPPSSRPMHGRSVGIPRPPSDERTDTQSSRSAGGIPPSSRDGGTGSLFGPLRSDATAISSSTTRASSPPLAFTADGKSLLPTRDTGPDFSRYGSNPFYLNSSVKLPIPIDYTYTSTKEPFASHRSCRC